MYPSQYYSFWSGLKMKAYKEYAVTSAVWNEDRDYGMRGDHHEDENIPNIPVIPSGAGWKLSGMAAVTHADLTGRIFWTWEREAEEPDEDGW